MSITLAPADKKYIKTIKKLYLSAFPPEERPPFWVLRLRGRGGRGRLLAAEEDGRFVGFVYLISHMDMEYLFFFAVDEKCRGGGVGSAILTELRKMCAGKRLFLALERLDERADNYPMRLRRHNFYLRNGFVDMPRLIKEAGVVFASMSTGGVISCREYESLITAWGGPLYRKIIDMRMMEI